jgi:hypothetical protein
MEYVAANAAGEKPALRIRNGREYLVLPITIFPPGGGVMNGSKGPLYYPASVCAANVGAWNDVPLTGRHPQSPDGGHVSANDAGVLDEQGLGFLANDRLENGRRRVDGWFDVAACKNYDAKNGTAILASAQRGDLQEVSTGLMTDDRRAENGASWNGRPYTAVVAGWTPDHLAVLPDQKGACSVADGCGVNNADHEHHCAECEGKPESDHCDKCKDIKANAGRYGNPQSQNTGKFKRHGSGTGKGDPHDAAQRGAMVLTERDRELGADAKLQADEGRNPAAWVADEAVWDRAKEAADKGGYDGETYWAAVTHIYKNMGGAIAGNAFCPTGDDGSANKILLTVNAGEQDMILNEKQRATIVTELTANCACWRGGAEVLNEMADERLLAVAKAHKEATENAAVADAVKEALKPPATLSINEMPAFIKEKIAAKEEEEDDKKNPAENMDEEEDEEDEKKPAANAKSAEQWLAEAPAEIRTAVANAMALEKREKQALVGRLTANVADGKARGRLTVELGKKTLNELRDLALLVPAAAPARNEAPPPDYSGLGIGEPTENAADDDGDILEIPTINWAAEAASRRRETARTA